MHDNEKNELIMMCRKVRKFGTAAVRRDDVFSACLLAIVFGGCSSEVVGF